jgi:hypothetical protein
MFATEMQRIFSEAGTRYLNIISDETSPEGINNDCHLENCTFSIT